MKKKQWLLILLPILAAAAVLTLLFLQKPPVEEDDGVLIYDLRTEDLNNPVGLDDPTPAFSWKMASAVMGQKQTAYQLVVTSVKEDTGTVETSNADVNQLVSNSRWGMYSNYLSISTDCPQRSERQGWTGDAQIFAQTGMYLGENKSFLIKFMEDMVDSQRADGVYPQIAPMYHIYSKGGYGHAGWADAGIIIPYYLYMMYGDASVITDYWESMDRYMAVMAANNGPLEGPAII